VLLWVVGARPSGKHESSRASPEAIAAGCHWPMGKRGRRGRDRATDDKVESLVNHAACAGAICTRIRGGCGITRKIRSAPGPADVESKRNAGRER
jgi:hypothetical protein